MLDFLKHRSIRQAFIAATSAAVGLIAMCLNIYVVITDSRPWLINNSLQDIPAKDIDYTFPLWAVVVVTYIFSIVVIAVVGYMLHEELAKQQIVKLPERLPAHSNRHPILIIDDDEVALEEMVDALAGGGYDITTSLNLTDARIVERYGIIICDIDGVGPVDDAIAVLNNILKTYPYKVLIPISSLLWKKQWTHTDIKIISKKSNNHLVQLPKLIANSMATLNKPQLHWDKIKVSLDQQNLTKEDIEDFRIDFSNYISKLS